MQWSTDITEHAHVTEVKNPVRASNNQDYHSQITHHLDCMDKYFWFDLTTWIMSSLRLDSENHGDEDDMDGEEHKLDREVQDLLFYYSPTCKVVDYFQAACLLANDARPSVLKPLRTFASSTTAIHLALKPSL